MAIRLPDPSLVVLIGPSGAGKSTWAEAQFPAGTVVSSDHLRSLVGTSEFDQRASVDAFAVLNEIVERRLSRRLLTVIDTLGLNAENRVQWRTMAADAGVRAYAITFDTEPATCRERNRKRTQPVPAQVLTQQIKTWQAQRETLAEEGFEAVFEADRVRIVPLEQLEAPLAAGRQADEPMGLKFELQIPRFSWDGGAEATAAKLIETVGTAEQVGFTGIWVMDHFVQIPQVGPEWDDMLDSYTTLSFLAAHTERARLGTMVTGVTYRNVGHLAKIIATLDVLSGGRAICGLGAGWSEREHLAYGYEFPSVSERFRLLEDALQALPLLWGPGSPSFAGPTISIPEAISYPRPLQDPMPILVGGGGEKKTLRLVAQYADACNLFGNADMVRHKLSVLTEHCGAAERDPADIEVTHLSGVVVGADRDQINERIESALPRRMSKERFAWLATGATPDDHVGRFRELAEAGVQTAVVSFPGAEPDQIEEFAPVVEAFQH